MVVFKSILTGITTAGLWHFINKLIVPIREKDWTIETVKLEEIPQEYLKLSEERDRFVLDTDKIRETVSNSKVDYIPGLRVYQKIITRNVLYLVFTTVIVLFVTFIAVGIIFITYQSK